MEESIGWRDAATVAVNSDSAAGGSKAIVELAVPSVRRPPSRAARRTT
jgi:hypothetical protein